MCRSCSVGPSVLSESGAGYLVLETDCGPAALGILNDSAAVELVFTDMVMPCGMRSRSGGLASRAGYQDALTSGYPGDPGIDIDSFDEDVRWVRKPYEIRTIAQKLGDMLDD